MKPSHLVRVLTGIEDIIDASRGGEQRLLLAYGHPVWKAMGWFGRVTDPTCSIRPGDRS